MRGKCVRRVSLILTAILFVAIEGGFPSWAQQPETAPPAPPAAASPSAAPQEPVGPNDVVMTVGDVKITAAEFDAITKALPPDAAGALASMGKRGFAERYANLVSLAKEGEKRKVDQSPEFQQMAEFQRKMLLAQLTLNAVISSIGEVTPEEISYYYTEHKLEFQQLKLRGIYIPFTNGADPANSPAGAANAKQTGAKPKLTEAEAKAKAETLRARISGGESMAAIAKKESEHPSAANGGELGYIPHGRFTPQIDNVLFNLEPNKISIPVKDRFGYFLFEVEEKRVEPLDEAKKTIENALRQQKVGEALSKVQAEYPTTYNPSFFNEPMPSAPGRPMPPAGPAK